MSVVTRPRGPLPARVYWTRRLLLVAVALALVFGFARLLGGGGGSPGASAQPVDASASSSAPASSSTATDSPTAVVTAPTVDAGPTSAPAKAKGSASATPLPAAAGPCSASDVVATPAIKHHAYAGKPVVFAMELTTKSSPACDFTVSPHSLVLKITSGTDRIWSTQQCTGAIPKQDVVVRKDTAAVVDLAWNGQRSDADCSRSTAWAEPGYYHAVAAAYGADPVDEQFKLEKPRPARVTAKPSPTATPSASGKASPSANASPTASKSPSPSASPTKKNAAKPQR